MKIEDAGSSSPALDRLREKIAEWRDEAETMIKDSGSAKCDVMQVERLLESAGSVKACAEELEELVNSLVRELVPVPPELEITIVKLTDEQAVSALCILDGCQYMKAAASWLSPSAETQRTK